MDIRKWAAGTERGQKLASKLLCGVKLKRRRKLPIRGSHHNSAALSPVSSQLFSECNLGPPGTIAHAYGDVLQGSP